MPLPRPIPGWRPATPGVLRPEIDELTRRFPAVAIHFWAVWNGYDQMMDRTIQAIRDRFAGRVHFVSCDTDRTDGDIVRHFGVANIPAIVLVVAGRAYPRIMGIYDPARLADAIEALLTGPIDPPGR